MNGAGATWLGEAFGAAGKVQTVPAGELLFRLGDVPAALYLVLEGEARARRFSPDGAEILMQRSRAGELFAEAGLVAPRYSCEAFCPLITTILRIPLAEVRARIANDGEFALRFAQFQAVAMRRQCARYERLRLKRAADRVLHYLNCELTGPAGATLALDIPLAEWADDLGLEPETLYRTLAELEKKGLIQREPRGRRIRIAGAAAACGG
ncbi:MAG: Crp/Fnr family transcriptional regulator [Betaproteobacteria bacterium]|nr:Crp/Fnr family transcriptional regulator [Betaproteobacteria bacterium]